MQRQNNIFFDECTCLCSWSTWSTKEKNSSSSTWLLSLNDRWRNLVGRSVDLNHIANDPRHRVVNSRCLLSSLNSEWWTTGWHTRRTRMSSLRSCMNPSVTWERLSRLVESWSWWTIIRSIEHIKWGTWPRFRRPTSSTTCPIHPSWIWSSTISRGSNARWEVYRHSGTSDDWRRWWNLNSDEQFIETSKTSEQSSSENWGTVWFRNQCGTNSFKDDRRAIRLYSMIEKSGWVN